MRDIEAGTVMLARRDTLTKSPMRREDAVTQVPQLLAQLQTGLFEKARADRDERTSTASDKDAFVSQLKAQRGFVLAPWCERPECELAIKAETSAVTRVITGAAAPGETCAFCGLPAKVRAYFARSY